jgi:hypothetical protein
MARLGYFLPEFFIRTIFGGGFPIFNSCLNILHLPYEIEIGILLIWGIYVNSCPLIIGMGNRFLIKKRKMFDRISS